MKTIAMLLLLLTACADPKTIDGVTYQPYGLINEHEVKDEAILYRPVVGNIVWSCLLLQTFIAPGYFVGYALFEPSGKKTK